MKKLFLRLLATVLSALMIFVLVPTGSAFADVAGVYTFDYESDYSVYQSNCRRSTTRTHSGGYALECDTDLSWKMIQAPLNAGDVCGRWHTLVVDFWIYFDSTFDLSKLTESIRVYTYGSSWCGAPASEQGANIAVNGNFLGNWSHVSATFSNNGNNMKPYLYIMQCGGFGGKVYIDDVTITTLSWGAYSGGAAQVLKNRYDDYANNDIIVPGVAGGAIPTPTRSGFIFDGWYTESSYENSVTNYLTGANTYYAKWKGVWDGTIADSFESGTGTAADPYIIASATQLAKLVSETGSVDTSNKYYKLVDDIYLNDTFTDGWQSGAHSWYTTSNYLEYHFNGTFDGDGHVVSGIYINNSSDNRMGGLFPSLRGTATVKNLGIVDSSITFTGASSFAGAIAGATDGSFTISSCFADSSVDISAVHTAAGIIGKVDSNSAQTANIQNVYSLASLSGTNCYGLLGYLWRNYSGTVTNVYTVGHDLFSNDNNGQFLTETNGYSDVKEHNYLTHTCLFHIEYMTGFEVFTYMDLDWDIWKVKPGVTPYLRVFSDETEILGDLNADNEVDVKDLVAIKKYAAGITRRLDLTNVLIRKTPAIVFGLIDVRKYIQYGNWDQVRLMP